MPRRTVSTKDKANVYVEEELIESRQILGLAFEAERILKKESFSWRKQDEQTS